MIKNEFIFEGSSKKPYQLHSILWMPEPNEMESIPKKVLHILHGMTEHIGRYDELAQVLTKEGIAVVGYDLRGHGMNKALNNLVHGNETEASTFGINGWEAALEDIHLFQNYLKELYPKAQQYILGFSLGSFLLREYLNTYENENLSGAIIVGTGYQPGSLLGILQKILQGEIKKVGFDKSSQLVRELSFGQYNKNFKPNRTISDWLCSDEEALDIFLADELRTPHVSAGLFCELLKCMKRVGGKGAYENWNKNLPVLLLSGEKDSVGNMTKGVTKVYNQMKDAGVKQVHLEILKDARHDLLHEYKCGAAKKTIHLIREFIK